MNIRTNERTNERVPLAADLELGPEAGGPPLGDVLLLGPLTVSVVGPGGGAAVLVCARGVAFQTATCRDQLQASTFRKPRDRGMLNIYISVFNDSVLLR